MFFLQCQVYVVSSSSSCRAASTDIPDTLSPRLPIIYRLWQVLRSTSRILTQLLYVCSSWWSNFCPAIYGGPQEYITYELVPASLAVSCMSGSSNLDNFRDGRQVPYSWWSVATRTSSILLAALLCNCRLASSPAVYLASKSCVYKAISIRPLPGRNCVSFYRSGLISI